MTAIFPELTLVTGRTVLRPFRESDVDDVRAACADPLTQAWLPLPNPYTREAAWNWCTERSHLLRASGDGLHLAVIDVKGGRLLGDVGLKRTDWAARVTEIGYWVAPWARCSGIATEVTAGLSRWVLVDQGFERVELLAATGNQASRRVAERAGFVREGVLRNAGYVHAGRVDLVMYSLLAGDLG